MESRRNNKYLTREETLYYIEKAQKGDEEALEIIYENHKNLIFYVLKTNYPTRGRDKEDLIQIGSEAIIKAVYSFDHTKGCNFKSYVVPIIKGNISRYYRDTPPEAMRLPRDVQSILSKIHIRELHENTPEEIGEVLGVKDTDIIREALDARTFRFTEPLDKGVCSNPNDSDTGFSPLGDMLSKDLNGDNWLDHVALRMALEKLDPELKEVIRMRFFEDKHQQEIADELGTYQMKVHRMITRGIEELKKMLQEDV